MMERRLIDVLAAWWIVPVALICGALAFWGSQRHLSERAAAVEQRWKQRYAPVTVIVAARDLSAGRVLRESDLARREVPSAFVPGGALSESSKARVLGQQLLFPLRAGDALVDSHLAGRAGAALSARLQAGTRAVTVPVDEVSSQAGLVRPGDRIDLMLAEERTELDGRCVVVRPLLEAVTVLATGQTQRALPTPGLADGGAFDGAISDAAYSTITLDVTPEQGQLLAVGLRIGELVPLLRPEADEARTPTVLSASAGRRACSAATLRSPPAIAGPTTRASASSLELLVGGGGTPALSRHFFADP